MINFVEKAFLPIQNLYNHPNSQVKQLPTLDEIIHPTFQNEAEEEAFNERAAILEYGSHLSRSDAERIAFQQTIDSRNVP